MQLIEKLAKHGVKEIILLICLPSSSLVSASSGAMLPAQSLEAQASDSVKVKEVC